MEYLSIKDDDKILIVAPHPDDECIGAGGLLLMHPDKCAVWVLTDGGIGQGNQSVSDTREVRHEEFITEMEHLGVNDYYFFDIPDGTLTEHTDCMGEKDISKYTKLFVTGDRDGHPDHTAAFWCVINAIKAQNVEPQVYFYEVHSALNEPTHMLDISDVMERKKTLIRFHRSQLQAFPYDDFAETASRYRAMQQRIKNGYLEVYHLEQNLNGSENGINFEMEVKLQKQIKFYQLLTKWLDKRNKGKYISDFLIKNGIHKVAVYGYAELGRLAVDEVRLLSDIEISYVIDKRHFSNDENVTIVQLSDDNPAVDGVVVSAIYSFDDIRGELEEKGYKNIYSLEEIIDRI